MDELTVGYILYDFLSSREINQQEGKYLCIVKIVGYKEGESYSTQINMTVLMQRVCSLSCDEHCHDSISITVFVTVNQPRDAICN